MSLFNSGMAESKTRSCCHLLSILRKQVMPMSAYEIVMILLTGIGLLIVLIEKIGKK